MITRKVLLLLFLHLCCLFTFAQERSTDSLYNELRNVQHDTERVLVHVALAQHFGWNASDSLMSHGASAKSLAQKINYQKGIYLGEILIARACYVTGDYARGLTEAKAALQIAREKNNIEWERQTISQIGLLYQQT